MWRTSLALLMLLLGNWAVVPALAADPAKFIFANPLKGFVRQPFSAEVEAYSGGITGRALAQLTSRQREGTTASGSPSGSSKR